MCSTRPLLLIAADALQIAASFTVRGLRSPLDGEQNGMSNLEGRCGVSKAPGVGVIREPASPFEPARPVINGPAPQ